MSAVMDSYNVLIHGWSTPTRSCTLLQVCFQCCPNGETCLKHLKPNDESSFLDPSSTAFKGNANQKLLQTAASNSFKTYYPSGRFDKSGNVIYEGIDVDLLDMWARSMNFTYVYQQPEPVATWGSQLPNGSWTALIGEKQLHRMYTVIRMLI